MELIYSTYPEQNNIHQGRGYTREEIKALLDHATGVDAEFIILASTLEGSGSEHGKI